MLTCDLCEFIFKDFQNNIFLFKKPLRNLKMVSIVKDFGTIEKKIFVLVHNNPGVISLKTSCVYYKLNHIKVV